MKTMKMNKLTKLIKVALVAAGIAAFAAEVKAEPLTPAITGVKAQQRYPWNGKVDITYTASNLKAVADAKGMKPYLTVAAIDRATTPWTTNIADLACLFIGPDAKTAFTDAAATTDGAHHLVWDLDAQKLSLTSTNVVFTVTGEDDVQLWKGGPYWAQCNVGATKPQEYGYYFWWGDTVGYKYNNNRWDSFDGMTTGFSFSSGTEEIVTYNKDNAALTAAGYIDGTGNLVAAHDAATAHRGAPWRMPTDAEMTALVDKCTVTWTTGWNETGVNGCVVSGKDAYSNRSIFLPAAGHGVNTSLNNTGSDGRYWSSSPYSTGSDRAWYLSFSSSAFDRGGNNRGRGLPVRPLR